MNIFTANDFGKIIIIHLGKGDDVLDEINIALKEKSIKYAVLVSAIGSLRQISLHAIADTNDNPTNIYSKFSSPIELGSAQGLVIDGQPHFHLCASDANTTYIGHMEKGCVVQYLAEFCLLEIKNLEIERKMDEFGISYITNI